jgi:hypothetical protein
MPTMPPLQQHDERAMLYPSPIQKKTPTVSSGMFPERAVSYIKSKVEQIALRTPFILQPQGRDDIAVFHCSEIITGALLGKGAFCNVLSVAGIDVNGEYETFLSSSQLVVDSSLSIP